MAIPINSDVVTTPPQDSATVMVLRDSPEGLQVLLMRRHGNSGVLGGVHVFPGGKLDAADQVLAPAQLDLPLHALPQRLAEPQLPATTAAGLHVAALRETLEEAGLLLGAPLDRAQRQALLAAVQAGQGLAQALAARSHAVPVGCLMPWSRWITPRVPSVTNRRFDTRFFVTRLPQGQEAEHDNHEATEAVWTTPRAALTAYWARQMDLAPPQIMSLCQLQALPSVDAALALAASRPPLLVEPQPFDQDGARVICYPGDPAHPVSTPGWAGPTRLTYREGRFEPEGGLAAFWAV